MVLVGGGQVLQVEAVSADTVGGILGLSVKPISDAAISMVVVFGNLHGSTSDEGIAWPPSACLKVNILAARHGANSMGLGFPAFSGRWALQSFLLSRKRKGVHGSL